MDFGVVLQTNPPARRVVDLAKRAEANGFTHVWVFDSHVLWQEPFVILARILAETERIVVGPMVTNPGSRDWTVLASTFATLNDAYGPRTICGIGRGDSALRVIGRKPRTLAEMAEAMHVVKGLVAGETVDYHGAEIRFPWLERGWDLPMWGAGYGPRALDCIGRHADGFVLQLADPQILEWTRSAVMDAATRQGRAPGSVATAVVAPAYVGDDIAHQREQLRWFGGMVGNHVADLVKRYGEDASSVPKVLSDYIKDRADYDYSHHGRAGNPSTDFVPDNIVDRFCVLGRVEDHIAKLTALRDMGTDHFAIYLMHDAEDATLDAYGQSILPVLTGTAAARSPHRSASAPVTAPRSAGTTIGTSHAARSGSGQAVGKPAGDESRRGARASSDGSTPGDWQSVAGAEYERKGFSSRSGYGTRPALLIVDFINGFTDPGTGLGGDYGAELSVTAKLLDEFRARALPVYFTTVAYEPHLRDGGQFIVKVPALSILIKGSEWVKVDERIRPRPPERVVLKKYASAFFDTRLDMELQGLGVDTVIIVGCTTSGCIRASAIDSMQNGFRTVVVRDAVGDRAQTPHEVNLFDIDAKYGDVVSSRDVLEYLRGLGGRGGPGATADDEFQRWWNSSAS
ncbi:MAG: TIGR03842 family LLM class F420-dependent oxidoreductase [Chromatiales bacterium]|nr:TIGR03842 family LLM class F420-dependent oxidoreductase [Chromatiales bacterium]